MVSSWTGGLFSDEETQNHINVLELKAILFGLESLARHMRLAHIRILCGNSTEVACINKFGTSHSGKCDTLSKQIWKWHRKMKTGSQPHPFLEYKTQSRTFNLKRMRSIPCGNSGKIHLTTYAHN